MMRRPRVPLPKGLRRYRRSPWLLLAAVAAALVVARFPQLTDWLRPGPEPGGWAAVARVIDGDTVELSDGTRVRLLGIDTPEMEYSPRARTEGVNDPGAEEAKEFLRTRIEGRRVQLEYGYELQDRYGRTLAYLVAEDGTNVNLELVEEGLARAYREFDHPRLGEFLAAEEEARAARRGLWRVPD